MEAHDALKAFARDLDAFKGAIRSVSLNRLQSQSGKTEITIEPASEQDEVPGHWMSFILVSSDAVKVIFRVHFMTRDARQLASQAFGKAARTLTKDQASDFMKEYCNLVGGSLKRILQKREVATGVSLPLVTRGFDALFIDDTEEDDAVVDAWVLKGGSESVHCSIAMQVYKPEVLNDLQPEEANAEADAGEVEFL